MNFSIAKLCASEIATKLQINNTPPTIQIQDNLLSLIAEVLQPLRDKLGKPIIITSGYRCPQLNKIVGGVVNSQHLTGEAVDIKVNNVAISDLFAWIKKSDIEYDQLINEHNRWIHISYSRKRNRKQAFKL